MLEILYVFGGEKASGAENVILRLIDANRSRVTPHIFIAPGEFANKLKVNYGFLFKDKISEVKNLKKLNRSKGGKILFVCKAIFNYFILSYKVFRYATKNNISRIHVNTIVPASYILPAIVLSRIFARNIVWLWSDHDLQYYSRIDHLLSNICSKLYDKTLVVSKAVKRKFKDSDKIVVLYNGLSLSELKIDVKQRIMFRNQNTLGLNELVFGIAATLIERKGILRLVEVFIQLGMHYPNIKLVIVGHKSIDEVEYGESILDTIKGVESIQYLGPISDMESFYNGCDVIINNSSKRGSEPLGTTIIEAMAYEKIVLASRTGGSPEIISHKSDGFLFEADDNEELNKILVYAIENIIDLQDIRKNARLKVTSKFGINEMIFNYNSIIQNRSRNEV